MVNAANLANPTLTASVTSRTSQSRATPVQPIAPEPQPPVAEEQPLLTEFTVEQPSQLRTGVVGYNALQYSYQQASEFVDENLAASDSSEEAQAAPTNSLLNPGNGRNLYAMVQALNERQQGQTSA